jgi:two-component system response regulator
VSETPRPAVVRLLVIEDNSSDVYLLSLALERAGVACELNVFEDGQEAFSYIAKYNGDPSPCDLAIIDINIPKHSGVEVIAALRNSATFASLPIVVLTSSSSPRDRVSLESIGIHTYIVKPPTLEEFLKIGSVIADLLGSNPH